MAAKNTALPMPLSPYLRAGTIPALLLQRLASIPGWECSLEELVRCLTSNGKRDAPLQTRQAVARMAQRGLVSLMWADDPRHPNRETDTEKAVRMTATGAATLRENIPGVAIAPQRKPPTGGSGGPGALPCPTATGHTYQNKLPAHWAPKQPASDLPPLPLRPGAADHLKHKSRMGNLYNTYRQIP